MYGNVSVLVPQSPQQYKRIAEYLVEIRIVCQWPNADVLASNPVLEACRYLLFASTSDNLDNIGSRNSTPLLWWPQNRTGSARLRPTPSTTRSTTATKAAASEATAPASTQAAVYRRWV